MLDPGYRWLNGKTVCPRKSLNSWTAHTDPNRRPIQPEQVEHRANKYL